MGAMPLFVLKGVKKRFGTGKNACRALDGIDLKLPERGIVAITGRSGSGKSTLLNILLGIEKPTSGSVLFRGRDLKRFSGKDVLDYRRREVAMVFQHYNLFDDLSAFENVILPLLIRGEDRKSAEAKAEEVFDDFALGELKERTAGTLSGGEKQRIALLRSVVSSPKAILLDEPTGALDHNSARLVVDLLRRIGALCLVVLVTHDQEIVRECADEVVVLRDGKISERTVFRKIEETKTDLRPPVISKHEREPYWRKISANICRKADEVKEAFRRPESKKEHEPFWRNIIGNLRRKAGELKENLRRPSKKRDRESSWRDIFTKLHLRKNRKKDAVAFVSLSLGLSAVLLAVGFIEGSPAASLAAERRSLLYTYATIARTSYFSIEGSPLSYEKSVRPRLTEALDALESVDSLRIEPNLEYLFPPMPFARFEGEDLSGFSLAPVYDLRELNADTAYVIAGDPGSFKELRDVIVNEEFLGLVDLTPEQAVGKSFTIEFETELVYHTGDQEKPIVRDLYSLDMRLRIIAVAREFSFLNVPRAYYSYVDLQESLAQDLMVNLSEWLKRDVTYLDYLLEAGDDEEPSSYSLSVFAPDAERAESLFARKKALDDEESDLRISSTSYDIKGAYEGFTEVLSKALFIFTLACFLGVSLILGIVALSNFSERKKEAAVLSCLGASGSSIIMIFLVESLFIAFCSLGTALIASLPFSALLNSFILGRYRLANVIAIPLVRWLGVPYLLPLSVGAAAFFICLLFVLVPLVFYGRFSIAEELRDE